MAMLLSGLVPMRTCARRVNLTGVGRPELCGLTCATGVQEEEVTLAGYAWGKGTPVKPRLPGLRSAYVCVPMNGSCSGVGRGKEQQGTRLIGSSKGQTRCVMVIANLCDVDTSIGVALRDGTTKHTAGPHYTPLVRGIARLGSGAGEHGPIRHPAESPRASHPSVLCRHWRARGTENDLSTIRPWAGSSNTTYLSPV